MKDTEISSNRSFGFIFGSIFFLIGLYFYIISEEIKNWLLIISVLFFTSAILYPNLLKPLNYFWFKFGIYLGKIANPIIMSVIFFLVVTPIGIIMKIFKKDLLNLKFNNEKTYWIKKNGPKSKMKNQF
jgi:hypothetical protein